MLQRDGRRPRVELEGILPFIPQRRIVADERPVAAQHGILLLLHSVHQIEAVSNAVAVSNQDGRPGIGLGFEKGFDRVRIIRAHGHSSHVHAAVRDGLHCQVLLRHRLSAHGKFGYRASRRGLGHLPARVRIDLRIQHKNVHIDAGGQDVVQAPIPDVVGPAVAADNPDALAHQRAGHGGQVARFPRIDCAEALHQLCDARALFLDAHLGGLVRLEQSGGELIADRRSQALHQFPRVFGLLIEGHAHPQPELGVVFKQRVGPCRAQARAVFRVRRRGQVAAIDGRAARGVGDDGPVAEQLREQLDVGRLAAAGACAGEFEQRLEQLHVLHQVVRQTATVEIRDIQEEVPVAAFRLAKRRLGDHVDGFVLGLALALRRADFHA